MQFARYILISALAAGVLVVPDGPVARAQDGGLRDSLAIEKFSDVDRESVEDAGRMTHSG